MNKLNDIAIMNRSAKNSATVHMRDRYAPVGETNSYKMEKSFFFEAFVTRQGEIRFCLNGRELSYGEKTN